jgi:predicted N-acetyltransferase YhbS
MPVLYRNMLPEDEDAVFDLRMKTWGGASREWVRQGAYLDPQYSKHTFVAVDEGGPLLATVRYWPRHLRDASGRPLPVGCVASVVTVETARRQGHASKLMRMTLDSMREEGFEWALLFSSDMGVPLYESLGFHHYDAPYYKGNLVGILPNPGGTSYTIEHINRPFNIDDPMWRAARAIYDVYNAARPLSLVRDDTYWLGYYARRIEAVLPAHSSTLFLARAADGQPVGYLLVQVRMQDPPPAQPPNPYDTFFISETGWLPGHEEAWHALLYAALEDIRKRTREKEQPGGTVFLPGEEPLNEAVRALFGSTLEAVNDRNFMALTTSNSTGEADIAAIFSAPNAHFWIMDDF